MTFHIFRISWKTKWDAFAENVNVCLTIELRWNVWNTEIFNLIVLWLSDSCCGSKFKPFSNDQFYFQLYEDEKSENERLRRELEQTKRELRDAKTELDKMMRKHTDAARTAETNDKRVTPLSESTLDCDQVTYH